MAVVGRDIIFPGRHGEQIAEGHCRGIPDCWHLPPTRSALPGPCKRAAAPSPRGKTFQGYGFRDLKAGRRLGTPVKHSQIDPCRTRAAPPAALGWSQGKEPRFLLPVPCCLPAGLAVAQGFGSQCREPLELRRPRAAGAPAQLHGKGKVPTLQDAGHSCCSCSLGNPRAGQERDQSSGSMDFSSYRLTHLEFICIEAALRLISAVLTRPLRSQCLPVL